MSKSHRSAQGAILGPYGDVPDEHASDWPISLGRALSRRRFSWVARRWAGPLAHSALILDNYWTDGPVLSAKLLILLARPRGIEPLFSP
jgi:hypothetical protein